MPGEDQNISSRSGAGVEDVAPGTGTPTSGAELKALERQIAERDRRIQELTDSERYWAEQARGSAAGTPKRKPEPEDDLDPDLLDGLLDSSDSLGDLEGETPDKLIEALNSEGVAALAKRGFITQKQAQALAAKTASITANRAVKKAVGELLQDLELERAYGLNDSNPDMVKETAAALKQLAGDNPAAARDRTLLKAAAEIAKARMEAKAAKEPPKRNNADIDAQMGARSGFGSFEEGETDELSPVQQRVIAAFNREGGVQISEEGYRKRAGNVRMGGTPAGRMRRAG